MSTSNFNLRNIPENVIGLLKKNAAKQKISINSLILQIIENGLGITYKATKNTFHDLDYLAGTWSAEDEEKFNKNTKRFENIDKELWE